MSDESDVLTRINLYHRELMVVDADACPFGEVPYTLGVVLRVARENSEARLHHCMIVESTSY